MIIFQLSCIKNIYLIIFLAFLGSNAGHNIRDKCPLCGPYSALGSYCSASKLSIFNKYGVSTDSKPCAPIGKQILQKGGNAVDSMIAVLICMSVTTPESMGLGGGSAIVIYNASNSRTIIIDSRETAPAAAYGDLYNVTGYSSSINGPLAIAVPGTLAGLWYIYENYGSGRIPWSDLLSNSIDLCEQGFKVDRYTAIALESTKDMIFKHKEMVNIFVNPKTNQVFKEGEVVLQKQLGNTLRRLSKSREPHKLFYGDIAKEIIDDIYNQKDWPQKPIITVKDFEKYSVVLREPVVKRLKRNNLTLHSFPLPGSGSIVSFILNVMQRFTDLYPSAIYSSQKATLFWHRLVETFKFGYAQRSQLGDSSHDFDVGAIIVAEKLNSDEFAKEIRHRIDDKNTYDSSSGFYELNKKFFNGDHGTSHASVIDAEGNAVSVTSTINLFFGSKVMSPSTGILLNNEMNDFNTGAVNEFGIPPSDSNHIQPGKRPFSSMCPSIFTDDSGVRLVIGASGGPKITTAVALVAIRHLFFGENIKQAIDGQRLHHQWLPDKPTYEKCFPKHTSRRLEEKGHNLEVLNAEDVSSNVVAISRLKGKLYANSDYRKGGTVDGV